MDEHLTKNFQLDQIKTKLSRTCGLLAKLRYFAKTELLRTAYFAIFYSIFRSAIQVWVHHRNHTTKAIEEIQEKAIRIMSFKPKNEPTNPIFRNLKIMKFKDILAYKNCIFSLRLLQLNITITPEVVPTIPLSKQQQIQ